MNVRALGNQTFNALDEGVNCKIFFKFTSFQKLQNILFQRSLNICTISNRKIFKNGEKKYAFFG